MTTSTISEKPKTGGITTSAWLRIGLQAAIASILVVLLSQAAILALWPELAIFKPLESYPRTALFTLIPALAATGIFAWLVRTQNWPVVKFLWVSAGFLLVSFIPDFLLPIPNRTLQASSAAAFLHLVAGIVTVAMILVGYTRSTRASRKG